MDDLTITADEVRAEVARFGESCVQEPVTNESRERYIRTITDAGARHWRILLYKSEGLGKKRIMRAEGCTKGKVDRSHKFLRDAGYLVMGADMCLHLTELGKKKAGELLDRT